MRIKPNVKIVTGLLPLAPLVDLFFLLLVFFMISSSLVFWPGTKVDTKVQLPRSRVSSMSAADKLVITITRSGHLFFNDKPVEWDDLERELKQLVSDSKVVTAKRGRPGDGEDGQKPRSPLVVLRADKSIAYDWIVKVMSLARSQQLGVYLVTDPDGESGRDSLRILGEKLE